MNPKLKWPWDEFPEQYSDWEVCLKQHLALKQKFEWLVKHAFETTSISKTKAAELLEIPLIDMDEFLNSNNTQIKTKSESKLRKWSELK